jgi:uncharacterized protein YuzE
MKVSFQFDDDSNKVLAVYFELAQGDVHKTVEVSEGECYVDVDRKGKLLGVEMLVPGHLKINARKVARKYHAKGIISAVNKLEKALAA